MSPTSWTSSRGLKTPITTIADALDGGGPKYRYNESPYASRNNSLPQEHHSDSDATNRSTQTKSARCNDAIAIRTCTAFRCTRTEFEQVSGALHNTLVQLSWPELPRTVQRYPELNRAIQSCQELARAAQSCEELARAAKSFPEPPRASQSWPELLRTEQSLYELLVVRQSCPIR